MGVTIKGHSPKIITYSIKNIIEDIYSSYPRLKLIIIIIMVAHYHTLGQHKYYY